MNDVTIMIYFIFFASIVGATFAFMWKNIESINKLMNSPVDTNPKLPHPELKDAKVGDELLVVDFKSEIEREGTVDLMFTADKEFEDLFLKKSLKKRIEEIDDDEDEDGGLIVRK